MNSKEQNRCTSDLRLLLVTDNKKMMQDITAASKDAACHVIIDQIFDQKAYEAYINEGKTRFIVFDPLVNSFTVSTAIHFIEEKGKSDLLFFLLCDPNDKVEDLIDQSVKVKCYYVGKKNLDDIFRIIQNIPEESKNDKIKGWVGRLYTKGKFFFAHEALKLAGKVINSKSIGEIIESNTSNVGIVVAILDWKGKILFVEAKGSVKPNIDPKMFTGVSIFDIFRYTDFSDEFEKYGRRLLAGEPITLHFKWRQIREYHAYPFKNELGQVLGAVIMVVSFPKFGNQALSDELTDALTFPLFRFQLKKALDHAKIHNYRVGVLSLDPDGLTRVNELYGNTVGDTFIQTLPERLARIIPIPYHLCRRLDADDDNFLISVSEISKECAIEKIAQTVVEEFRNPFLIDRRELSLTVSVGVGIFPVHNDEPDGIIWASTQALHYVKSNGKNNFYVYKQ